MHIESRKLVQSIIDALPYYLFVTDTEGRIIYFNDEAEELFDIASDILTNMCMYDIFDNYEFILENGQKLDRSNNPVSKTINEGIKYKDLILKKSHAVKDIYLLLNCSPLIENERAQGAVISISDVTDEYLKNLRIKKEREQFISISTELKTKCDIIEILRNREKEHLMHLKDVMNNISEGLLVLDSKGKFSFSNKSLNSIIDITPAELLYLPNIEKKYIIQHISGEGEHLFNIYNNAFRNNLPIRDLVLKFIDRETNNTKYIEFNANPIANNKKQLLYTIITLKDITEIKEHEIFAEDQARFVRDVVNNMDIPIAVLEYPSFKTKLANKKFEYLIRYMLDSNEVLDDRSLVDALTQYGNEGLYDAIEFCGRVGREYTCSPYHVKDNFSNNRFYKIKFKPFKNRNGEVNRIHIHASDITEEINHSMELEKVTKLKDEFFTVISHELRTPLTIIYSSLQLAYNIYGKEITPNIHKTLFRINQNCSRLLKLINNILDISKAEAGFLNITSVSFDIVTITELIVTSVNSYAKSKGIDLIFDTNEEEAAVLLDKDKYEKILLNLLSNAIKFTPEGKQILVQLDIDKANISLIVRDDGIGIPEEKITYIFDRFAQVNSSLSRRAEGTGLGLSLVKKLVELMDGEIMVRSNIEKGSEFIIKFKRATDLSKESKSYAMIDENMNDKINIEFSDIG